jgi:hypothetical protein
MLDHLKEFINITEKIEEPKQFVAYEFDPEVINERIQSQVEVYSKQLLEEKVARLSTPHKLVGLDPDLDFGVQVAPGSDADKIIYKVNTDSTPALRQDFIERVSSAMIANTHNSTGLEVIPEQLISDMQSPQERDLVPSQNEISNTLGKGDYKERSGYPKEEQKKNEFRSPRVVIHSKSAKSESLEGNFQEKIQFSSFDKRLNHSESRIDSNPSDRSPVMTGINNKSRDNSRDKPRRHGLSSIGSNIVSSLHHQENVETLKFSPRLKNPEVPNLHSQSPNSYDTGFEDKKSTSPCEEKNRKLHGSPTIGKFQELGSDQRPISMPFSTSPKTVSTQNRKTKTTENANGGVYAIPNKKPAKDKPEKPKKLVIIYPNLPITTKKDLSSAYGDVFNSKPKSRTGNRSKLSGLVSPKVEGSSRLSTRSYFPSRNLN